MGTSPRLSEAFDEYLETLRIQGRSPSTIKARRLLCRTMLHSTGNLYLRSLTEKHVDQFFADNPQWSPATRAKMVAYLSAFLGWSQQRRYMPSNHDLLAHMRGIKTPKRKRLQIPPEKFPELLEAANNPRDRIVIALGIYLMLRGSEISHLRWHHVHLDEWEIDVWREKTDEWDRLPICTELGEELERWRLTLAAQVGIPQPDWYLTPGYHQEVTERDPRTGRIVQAYGAIDPTRQITRPYQSVKLAMKKLGYDTGQEGVHTLRRSGARALYDVLADAGHDRAARQAQSMLGHANLVTTERYLGVDVDRKTRNDLLKGRSMFGQTGAEVIPLGGDRDRPAARRAVAAASDRLG
jgi:integrase